MTKRICPSCGLGAYSADTVTTWICAQCGGPIPPSCEVEIERCKPSEIEKLITYAENRRDEACTQGEDITTIRYWAGYIDGLRALKRVVKEC